MIGSNMSVTFLDQLVDFTKSIGKVPKVITDAQENHRKVAEGASNLFEKPAKLNAALLDAIRGGRDVAADPEVQRIVVSQIIGRDGVAQDLITTAVLEYAQQLGAHADLLIEMWRKPFDDAVTDLTVAAKVIGDRSLDDARDILSRGGDAADHWVKANNANILIKDIVGKWNMLAVQTGFVPTSSVYHPLKYTTPSLLQWEALGLKDRKIDAWTAHREGLTLSLASPGDYMARQTRLEQERGQRERNYIEQMKTPGFAEFNDRVKQAEKAAAVTA